MAAGGPSRYSVDADDMAAAARCVGKARNASSSSRRRRFTRVTKPAATAEGPPDWHQLGSHMRVGPLQCQRGLSLSVRFPATPLEALRGSFGSISAVLGADRSGLKQWDGRPHP